MSSKAGAGSLGFSASHKLTPQHGMLLRSGENWGAVGVTRPGPDVLGPHLREKGCVSS